MFDKTTSAMAGTVAGLALLSAGLHSGAAGTRARLAAPMSADTLAERRVTEQFRANAAAVSPQYDVTTLAGSGAQGRRDGIGLYAQFNDPIDISLSPDGRRLLVVDDGGHDLRQIDTETRAVVTLTDWHGADARMFVLERAIAAADSMFLLSVAPHALFEAKQGTSRLLAPVDGGPADVTDVVYDNDRLFVLDGPSGRTFERDPVNARWRQVAAFAPHVYDRLTVDDNALVVVSSAGGEWSRFDLNTGAPHGHFTAPRGVQQVIADTAHGRYLALAPEGVSAVGAAFDALVPLPLWSIEGRRVGVADAPPGYRTSWLTGVTRAAFDARRNTLYALNPSAHRVTMMLSSFVNWKYGEKDPTPRPSMSADYPAFKPAASTRILWLSHSVFWDPAGLEDGNLALGAPRQLEALLNTTAPQAGRWEIVNPALTGMDFYTSVFPRGQAALRTYGFDHAVVVIDLQALYWALQFYGFTVPAAFDSAGMPVGIDAELAKQPMLDRNYVEPIRPLVEYMKTRMRAPSAPIPLLTASGALAPYQFLRAWTGDARFRSLLIDLYVKALAGLRKACDEAGVKLTVMLAPTSNFIAANEWVDAYAMGGTERPLDFETAHRPILERLWAEGIPAYDLTYDMLARNPRYFPFNAPTHHRSGLFHRALAESIAAVARRFDVLSLAPMPARMPRGDASASTATQPNVVVTARGDTCFVLHDIWDAARKTAPPSQFADLLPLGVADVARNVAARTSSCAEYRVNFVYIRNRDDYGNRDFRGIEPVASMRVPVARLAELEKAAHDRAAGDELRSSVQFNRQ